jgi:hypothetical protein
MARANAIDQVQRICSKSLYRFYTLMLAAVNQHMSITTHLAEPNGSRLLAEALTANVKAVFPDQTGLVRAHTASIV